MRLLPALLVAGSFIACTATQGAETGTAPAPNSTDSLLSESAKRLADGDYQGAISAASVAMQLDPKKPATYEARGSVYIQERLWDRAERDYTAAAKLSPDVVYKYKLAQISFYKKAYEDAASRFAALASDPNLGDLAYYEFFLCDLLGGHEAKAWAALVKRDQMPPGPSFYFCHAAWDLYHEDHAGATKAFKVAAKLYDSSTCDRYIASLVETRRFQLATATFTDRSGTAYNNVSIFLENSGLRVSTKQGWITLTLDQLPDDLSAFPIELREQINRKRVVQSSATLSKPESVLTFTTKAGQRYEQVHWSLQDTALSVLTPDGWIALPFADLPTDLSVFPSELRQAIQEKQAARTISAPSSSALTFTTKTGIHYEEMKATLSKDGVNVLTPDGWIAVSFRELPDDLSPFPAAWCGSIVEGREHAEGTSETQVVSFTTRRGVHYDQVRTSMEKSGLRVLTPDGLIAVPFNQLPFDVSVFPQPWRVTIAARIAATEKKTFKTRPTPAP